VRGSEKLAETLQRLVERERLNTRVEFTGAFCMEQCSMGVSVRVGDRVYRCVQPENVERFFYDEIMPRLNGAANLAANEVTR
jgi:NADH:ubiquinone oxidoreductase subunit E